MGGVATARRVAVTATAAWLIGWSGTAQGEPLAIESREAKVNGVTLHYLAAGSGPVVVLLHGYAQTSHMWRPLMEQLAPRHRVIAPDLRGFGGSSKPDRGYEKKNMARDIHALVESLGAGPIGLVGHDIGLMVAYAYAVQWPEQVSRLVLMDAFLPGIGDWKNVWLLSDLWHFHFQGETPLRLVEGRERIYFEHFWNDFAADKNKSVSEADRRFYTAAYAQPGGMRAGFEQFKVFPQDAADFEKLGRERLQMPVLVLTGEKASGSFLIDQARMVAANVDGIVVPGAGHWLIDEAPKTVIPALVQFLDAEPKNERLTFAEVQAQSTEKAGAGTSGLGGITTGRLAGNPDEPGLYTIVLTVPPNTRIEAHTHPDDRVATVVSGTWFLGYGDHFDEKKLKALPPGSFYTEPPNAPHFARTGDAPVVVQITGLGPTGTDYVGAGKAKQAAQPSGRTPRPTK